MGNETSALHQRLHRWTHLLRFLMVGGLNTLFGYGLFAFFVWVGLRAEIAIFLGNIIGPLFNYVTYGKLAFSRRLDRHNLPRFIGNYVAFYFINVALLRLCLNMLHLSTYMTQLILTPFMALGMFFTLRYFVFRHGD